MGLRPLNLETPLHPTMPRTQTYCFSVTIVCGDRLVPHTSQTEFPLSFFYWRRPFPHHEPETLHGSFHFLFHYPNRTPIYPLYIPLKGPSSFNFLFHYPNRTPIFYFRFCGLRLEVLGFPMCSGNRLCG